MADERKYRIAPDFEWGETCIAGLFNAVAAREASVPDIMKCLDEQNSEVNIVDVSKTGGHPVYSHDAKTLGVATVNEAFIAKDFGVSVDNLPPVISSDGTNFSSDFNPDLWALKIALHELEHVTQFEGEAMGSIFQGGRPDRFESEDILMMETDADNAVHAALRSQGMEEDSQQLRDKRTIKSVVEGMVASMRRLDHDTGTHMPQSRADVSFVSGDVMDPIKQKYMWSRFAGLRSYEHPNGKNYGGFQSDWQVLDAELEGAKRHVKGRIDMEVGHNVQPQPQHIMPALEAMLESNKNLSDVQKSQISEYLVAAKRLGYEPDYNEDAYQKFLREKLVDAGLEATHQNQASKTPVDSPVSPLPPAPFGSGV